MAKWTEIEKAEKESRRELVLAGADISKKIDHRGLDENLFKLVGLNFLEISRTSLVEISESLGELSNLTNLVLCHNKLKCVPLSIGKLQKLKLLDLARNELESVPTEVTQLGALQTLNISGNNLSDFPDVTSLSMLHVLELSHNALESLPDGIPSTEMLHLADLKVNGNKLNEIPSDMSELPALKILDVSNNSLTEIPADICECIKLKEFNFGNNKLKDRKLGRMGEQCKLRAVFDYLNGILQKERQGGKGGKKSKVRRKKKKSQSEVEDLTLNLIRVLHFDDDNNMIIKCFPGVQTVRPYIVACAVRHLNFLATKNMYKRFIALQTRLHDSICNKRQAATIATHDLNSVGFPLTYESRPPEEMMLCPLFRQKDVSAVKMVSKLRQEAEELRKKTRRNAISGIHKYLDLLKGKSEYPCLVDNGGTIISFPPITNCDSTKISKDTTDILIEVTSSSSLDTCKKVMQELLQSMLEMGVGQEHASAAAATADADADCSDEEQASAAGEGPMFTNDQCLVVGQVKVTDEEGNLKVVYPSRVDLMSDAFRVVR